MKHSAGKIKLPYQTLYFDNISSTIPCSHGCALTEVGALRATLTRLGATRQYVRAIIIDWRTHRVIQRLKRTATGISMPPEGTS